MPHPHNNPAGVLAATATPALTGTAAKVEAMAERASLGLSIFHPGDPTDCGHVLDGSSGRKGRAYPVKVLMSIRAPRVYRVHKRD